MATAGRGLAALLATFATIALGFMMMITVADVVLRAIDPNWRIFGMLDYVEFSLAWLIFLAIPLAVVERRMIAVDVVDTITPPSVGRGLRGFALILTLAAFVLIATQIVTPALEIREWGETTLDLRLPKFWYWIAIWVGIGASIIAVILSAPAELAGDAGAPRASEPPDAKT